MINKVNGVRCSSNTLGFVFSEGEIFMKKIYIALGLVVFLAAIPSSLSAAQLPYGDDTRLSIVEKSIANTVQLQKPKHTDSPKTPPAVDEPKYPDGPKKPPTADEPKHPDGPKKPPTAEEPKHPDGPKKPPTVDEPKHPVGPKKPQEP